jgi:Undecaprenyl-phosphate galactose phosphotransferase WbaP
MNEIIRIWRTFIKVLCLVVIDLLAFYASLFAAWVLRAKVLPVFILDLPDFDQFSYLYFVSLWWIPALFIFFIFYEGLYDRNRPFWDETRVMVKAIFLATLTVMAIVTLGKMQDRVSRLVLLGTLTVSLFAFPLFRLWGKRLLSRAGVWRERTLILGAGNAGKLVMEGLRRETHMGYEVIGFLDDDEKKWGEIIEGKKVFGRIRHYPKFVKDLHIVTVIIAMPTLPPERLSALTAGVQNHAANTMVIPDMKGIALLNTDLLHLFYEEIFLMNIKNNLKFPRNRVLKRVFDFCVGVALLPILLPLIGLIALAIRLDTPGKAMYAHARVGRNGGVFRCLKFRTMQKDAEERLKEILEGSEDLRSEWERSWKLRDDPRVTKVGSFLRKTSLDELPQIFNVLTGDMSLVGPRPVTQDEIKTYYKDMSGVCFSVPPGITGLWQVSGRSDADYDRRVKLDAWYIMNWSPWLDIVILFKTARVVLKMEGAY